jgi:hypothetical protein
LEEEGNDDVKDAPDGDSSEDETEDEEAYSKLDYRYVVFEKQNCTEWKTLEF